MFDRHADIAAVSDLIADCPAFLAVVGPGGVGKTRLAIAVIERLADKFPGRVAFVALADIRKTTDVLPVARPD